MMFKNSIQTILLGFALWACLLLGLGQTPVLAATFTDTQSIAQERGQDSSELALKLLSGVDSFLSSIPSGYYAIANVTELKSELENPHTLLVDVRERYEYQSGHIPNAINLPLRTLADQINAIPHDRSVILYCSSGYRSAMGVMTLHLLGYDNVKGFPPSFAGWKAVGEAISK